MAQTASGAVRKSTAQVNPSRQDSVKAAYAGWLGGGFVLLGLIAFALTTVTTQSLSSASIGLVVLTGVALCSVSLIGLIALTRAMGLADANQALGLPRGSVRAILALVLAVIFVSVASWTLGGMFSPLGPLVAEANLPKDSLQEFLKLYQGDQFVISEFGADPKSQTIDAKVYYKRGPLDTGLMDIAKQIVTISATVLVTVVGFYFGSKSSSDAVRAANDSIASMKDALDSANSTSADKKPASGTADGTSVSASAIAAIASNASSKLKGLGDSPLDAVQFAKGKPEFATALKDQIAMAESSYATLLDRAKICEDGAAKATALASSSSGDASTLALQMQALQDAVTQANHEFEEAYTSFAEAVKAVKNAVAM